jgi:hypothetical protein
MKFFYVNDSLLGENVQGQKLSHQILQLIAFSLQIVCGDDIDKHIKPSNCVKLMIEKKS